MKFLSNIFLAALLISAGGYRPALAALTVDGVAAVVNEDVILISEVRKMINDPLFLKQLGYTPDQVGPEVKKRTIDRLVERKLVLHQAAQLKITVEDPEVMRVIEKDVLPKTGLSFEQLEQELDRAGKTFAEYKNDIREDILHYRVLEMQLHSFSGPEVSELRSYYTSHADEFTLPGGATVWLISLAVRPGTTAQEESAAEKLAAEIHSRLNAGEDFAKLAGQYSSDSSAADGGKLGFFASGELIPTLDRAAAELKEGEFSEPIKTTGSIFIIRVTDSRPTGLRSFDEVRPEIEAKLGSRKREKAYAAWIDKLKDRSYIKVFNMNEW